MNKYFHTANNKALHPSNEFIIDSSLHKHFFLPNVFVSESFLIQIRDSPNELFTRYCLHGRIDSFDISKQLKCVRSRAKVAKISGYMRKSLRIKSSKSQQMQSSYLLGESRFFFFFFRSKQ